MVEAKMNEKTAEKSAQTLGDFEEILKLMLELSKNPATAPTAESVANTLLTVIGSGPSFAAMQSLVAANQDDVPQRRRQPADHQHPGHGRDHELRPGADGQAVRHSVAGHRSAP